MKNRHGYSPTIWTATPDQALALPHATRSLCDEEIAQAHRLKQACDRTRYLAARALLRHALSDAVDGEIKTRQWRYCNGPTGKPMMAPNLPQLEFNISHTGNCVAVGVSNTGPIGVDIEMAVPDERAEIVNDVLSERERDILHQLPDDQKGATFIQFWTLKEACAKALGLGVTLDFSDVEIALDPPRVLNSRDLLGPVKEFAIENRPILADQFPYCLSVVKINETADTNSFCYKPLTCSRAAQSSDARSSRMPDISENQVMGWE